MSGKRVSRTSKKALEKDNDEYKPDSQGDEELDHAITTLEADIMITKNKRKREQSPNKETPEKRLKETQGEVVKPPKQLAKVPKVWIPSEAALLAIKITGCAPLGRNVTGMLFPSLSLFSHLFPSFLTFVSVDCFAQQVARGYEE